jgi:hypothetical protein
MEVLIKWKDWLDRMSKAPTSLWQLSWVMMVLKKAKLNLTFFFGKSSMLILSLGVV